MDGIDITRNNAYGDWRSNQGTIVATKPAGMTNVEFGKRMNEILEKTFGVHDAFLPPSEEDENANKQACYMEQHRIDGSNLNLPIQNMSRQEVFPGYTTFVDKGKWHEYEQRYGEIALVHSTINAASIPQILRTGLMSTSERLLFGNSEVGLSSVADLRLGGGESVFTCAVTANSLRTTEDEIGTYGGTLIVLKPELMDRTDMYAYGDDNFGRTDPITFDQRLTPEELLSQISEKGINQMSGNEQMFKHGIPVEAIAGISVSRQADKEKMIATLHADGITAVNGVIIEDFIHVTTCLSQVLDIAHGRPPRETRITNSAIDPNDLSQIDLDPFDII